MVSHSQKHRTIQKSNAEHLIEQGSADFNEHLQSFESDVPSPKFKKMVTLASEPVKAFAPIFVSKFGKRKQSEAVPVSLALPGSQFQTVVKIEDQSQYKTSMPS
jgi:hypothetical protein